MNFTKNKEHNEGHYNMDSRQRAHAGGFFQDLFGTIGMIQLPFFFLP